jgi:hypothetical protein
MAKVSNTSSKLEKSPVNRPGIHAKTKTSKNKKSRNYKKAYCGQGRAK